MHKEEAQARWRAAEAGWKGEAGRRSRIKQAACPHSLLVKRFVAREVLCKEGRVRRHFGRGVEPKVLVVIHAQRLVSLRRHH